ncbi:hypothetical protein ANME2D_02846 [Candidatus Methanoperedens nitroreducens]|uniref:Uncharacterized protein n=1 Tax=Candidatus Methanoperedens nitratireducens TaxID=1392998 RepID=A0A062UUX2_9EURY|nr:hypothetical protein [Candidatus Methanoperedens nitroreducens]KCZ70821.1 hypothetical protein ANME2D_02846 [Candidatus Methanoperedens nitroreducens]MDJ1420676.1 hypothetical protein [Candidatus Methanoperedens sp.]
MGNTKYLMVLAIAAVGLFAMPNLLATYAGTHTVEYNDPNIASGSSGKALDCRECHQYIFDAAALASANAGSIWVKHGQAADDTNYTTYVAYYGTDMNNDSANISAYPGYNLFFTANAQQSSGKVKPGDILGRNATGAWIVVSNAGGGVIGQVATDSYGGKEWSACLVCHRAAYFYGGTHTRVQVRGCTNEWCHGANTTVSNPSTGRDAGVSYMADISKFASSKAAQTGKQLNRSVDAHNKWFRASAEQPDYYKNALTGEQLNQDYYTCMGCHTHANVQLNIEKSTGFDANLTSMGTGAITVDYTVNTTNTTVLTSTKYGGAFK